MTLDLTDIERLLQAHYYHTGERTSIISFKAKGRNATVVVAVQQPGSRVQNRVVHICNGNVISVVRSPR